MAEQHSLLAVFAHPDDEAFGTGGTLARYAGEGVRVALVCATRGEVGSIADPNLATPEPLGDVREAELYCAAQALGISEVIFLGYRDSGMAGAPENENPRAFVNAPAEEVVRRLVGIIRRLRPDVVVTFEPNGGYGHPDHIAIHRHTVAAFHAAGDAAQYPDRGRPWQPARLFYTTIPRSFFCWKLEIFFSNCTDLEAVKRYFLDAGRKDPTLHGKWLKQEMEIPRDKLTSRPAAGHPAPDVRQDGVILIYTTNIAERDARRAKILANLKARGLYRKDAISSRRGCVNFDELIGPWTGWYDLERDYPAGEGADGV